jgi:predicted MFS family arabinose efflux permease
VGLLRTAFGNRGIARVETAGALSALGAWTFSITLALYAYYEDGPGGVALAVAARMLPAPLFSPFAERIAARYSRRAVLVASALASFLLLEAIAVVVAREMPIALLLALAALFEIAASQSRGARASLLVELARTPAELAAAGAERFVEYAGFLLGAVAAGVLVASGGLDTAFAVAGVAFVAEAGVGWRLPSGVRARLTVAGAAPFEPLRRAVRSVRAQPWLRVRIGLFGAGVLVQSMLELLLVVAAIDLLALGSDGVGWLRAAFAAGGLAGGAAAFTMLGRGRMAGGIAIGLVLAGVPLALIPAWPAAVPALVLLILLGGGFALVEASLLLLSPRLAPVDALLSLIAVEDLVYPLARAAGTGLAAWLVVQLGDTEALVVAGAMLPVLAVVSIRSLLRAERRATIPTAAFRLLRGLPAFAALPRSTVENLAMGALPERFEAGRPILRAGLDRDSFRAIDAGDVEMQADGRPPSRLGPGEAFGEAALMRDGRAESTATALTDVDTLTIARADFLSRIGGVSRTRVGAPVPGPSARTTS